MSNWDNVRNEVDRVALKADALCSRMDAGAPSYMTTEEKDRLLSPLVKKAQKVGLDRNSSETMKTVWRILFDKKFDPPKDFIERHATELQQLLSGKGRADEERSDAAASSHPKEIKKGDVIRAGRTSEPDGGWKAVTGISKDGEHRWRFETANGPYYFTESDIVKKRN